MSDGQWFGAQRVLAGQLTVGDVIVFLAYLGMLYQPMNAFSHGSSSGNTPRANAFPMHCRPMGRY